MQFPICWQVRRLAVYLHMVAYPHRSGTFTLNKSQSWLVPWVSQGHFFLHSRHAKMLHFQELFCGNVCLHEIWDFFENWKQKVRYSEDTVPVDFSFDLIK